MARIRQEQPETLAKALTAPMPDIFAAARAGEAEGKASKLEAFKAKLANAGILKAHELGTAPQDLGLSLDPERDLPADLAGTIITQARTQGSSSEMAAARAAQNEFANRMRGAQLDLGQARLDLEKTRMETQPERQAKVAALKDFQTKKAAVSLVEESVSKLRRAAESLGDFKPGAVNQTRAKAGVAYGNYANDPTISSYKAAVGQEISKMVRGLGQTGVLTDQDIKLGEAAMGNMTMPLADKYRVLAGLVSNAYASAAASARNAGDDAAAAELTAKGQAAVAQMFPEGGLQQLSTTAAITGQKEPHQMTDEELLQAAISLGKPK